MIIKLSHGLAGDRFSFAPRQIVKCSDKTGTSYVANGSAVEVPGDTPIDGELFDVPAVERLPAAKKGRPETATKPVPKTPEDNGAGEKCTGTTKAGNACLRTPETGKATCSAHSEG